MNRVIECRNARDRPELVANRRGGDEMLEWIRNASPRGRARLIGVEYLLYFLTAIVAQLLVGRKFVAWGNAINLVATSLYAILAVLLYHLFKPVNRNLSLLAALISLAGCTVMALGFLKLPSPPVSMLLFFGPYCLLLGYLIFRSTFLPHFLGVLMALAGVGWLAFLSPTVEHFLSLYIETLGIIAEASLMLWLIVMGVSERRLKKGANAVGTYGSIEQGKDSSLRLS
jgi:hypothetical protein